MTFLSPHVCLVTVLVFTTSSALRLGANIDTNGLRLNDKMGSIPKNIFMYWNHDEVPPYTQMAAKSWVDKNPSWNFHMIHDSNLHTYINDTDILNLLGIQGSPEFKSDLVRTNLLALYGGVYADGDVFCLVPLDEWLPSHMASGFFAYRIEENKDHRVCSSWFLAAAESSYIANKLQKVLNAQSKGRQKPAAYYEWHYTFTNLVKTDTEFKRSWDASPQKFSLHLDTFQDSQGRRDECVIALRHLPKGKGININSLQCLSVYRQDQCLTVKALIDSHCSPVYKINRRASSDKGLWGIAEYIATSK